MLFLVAILLGVAVGYVFGGRLSNLEHMHLRGLWLVGLALLLQVLIFPLFTEQPIIGVGTAALHVTSYGFLFAFLLVNVFRVRPLLLVGVGAALNLLVIGVNGGLMPASRIALERAGAAEVLAALSESPVYGNIVLLGETTKLNVLGDILYLPAWFPLARTFSLGDLLVILGLMLLIVRGMRAHA